MFKKLTKFEHELGLFFIVSVCLLTMIPEGMGVQVDVILKLCQTV